MLSFFLGIPKTMNIALLKETLHSDGDSVDSSSFLVNGHWSKGWVDVNHSYWWQVDLIYTFQIGRIVILANAGS